MVTPLRVVVTDPIVSRFASLFTQLSPEHQWHFVAGLSPEEQTEFIAKADVLVCAKLSAQEAGICTARLVHVTGSGTDRVALAQLPASTTIARTAHHELSIAEHILMVILAHQRRLLNVTEELREGTWRTVSTHSAAPMHRTFADLTIGFVGLGAIGEQALKFTSALGANAVAVRRTAPTNHPNPRMKWVKDMNSLPELLQVSDVVVLGLPLTTETRGLIGSKELAQMRSDALLVNVSRGAIIDQAALWWALNNSIIGGAALDVWWDAPQGTQTPAEVHEFASLPNVICTPHYSGHAARTFENRVREIAENINAFAGELPLSNTVR